MTRYYVNDREVEAPPDFTSFDQMLKTIEGRHLEPDTVIREIHVDGQTLTPDRIADDDWVFGRTENWEKIEIFTGTLSDIAQESVAGAQDYLDKIERAVPALAVKFQDMPMTGDFANLSSLCEGFLFLSMLLDKLSAGFRVDPDQIVVRGASAREQMQRFAGIAKQLVEAQERQDYILIADTLEYEILPVVPVWREIFAAVLEKVNRAQ
jgi:hypothetical protein